MSFNSEFEKYAVKHRGLSSNTLHSYASHLVTGMTPNIIEERSLNIAVMDVYSRLMMDRIIFLGYPINDEIANIVTAQLLFLDSTDRTRDINMYINSPGGSVYAGLGVYDTMQFVSPDISTICIGVAASMACVLLGAGTKGKRAALKHSRIMMHQPSGAIGGQASDIEITVNEIRKLKQELYEVVHLHTGKAIEQIEKDFKTLEPEKRVLLFEKLLQFTLPRLQTIQTPDIKPIEPVVITFRDFSKESELNNE